MRKGFIDSHIYIRELVNMMVLAWLLYISITTRSVSTLLFDADPTHVSIETAKWLTRGPIIVFLIVSAASIVRGSRDGWYLKYHKYFLSSIAAYFVYIAIAVLQSPFHNHMHFAPYMGLAIYNIVLAARFYANDRN